MDNYEFVIDSLEQIVEMPAQEILDWFEKRGLNFEFMVRQSSDVLNDEPTARTAVGLGLVMFMAGVMFNSALLAKDLSEQHE